MRCKPAVKHKAAKLPTSGMAFEAMFGKGVFWDCNLWHYGGEGRFFAYRPVLARLIWSVRPTHRPC